MAWQTPKTDWVDTDTFNISDYNLIREDILYICNMINEYIAEITIQDMGSALTTYTGYWNPTYFNAFETNIETANKNLLNRSIGTKMTFYVNGSFIRASELNRIGRALNTIKADLDGWNNAMDRLPFALGNKGGVVNVNS